MPSLIFFFLIYFYYYILKWNSVPPISLPADDNGFYTDWLHIVIDFPLGYGISAWIEHPAFRVGCFTIPCICMWHWWVHGRGCDPYREKARAWQCPFIGTSCTKHWQKWDRLLPAVCSVCTHCDELARIHLNACLRDQGLVWRKGKIQSKVRTRGWKAGWKLTPFGSGSLK